MSSLATKEVLEKELKRFEERVEFLEDYVVDLLQDVNNFEARDKAYKLSIEKEFKEHLIQQRKEQISQINKQDLLKVEAIKEIPVLLEDCNKLFYILQMILKNLESLVNLKEKQKNSVLKLLKIIYQLKNKLKLF